MAGSEWRVFMWCSGSEVESHSINYLGLGCFAFFPLFAVVVVLFPLVAGWMCPVGVIMVKTIPQTFAMSEFTPVVITVPRCLNNTNIYDSTPSPLKKIIWNILQFKTSHYIHLAFLNIPDKIQLHDILYIYLRFVSRALSLHLYFKAILWHYQN